MPDPRLTREDLIARLAEVFRAHGYDGASLAAIGEATGLGKGSLYHAFPGGKAEMAEAVLTDIESWFEARIFEPLRSQPPVEAVTAMLESVRAYFEEGRRICLVGAFALGDTRDRFAAAVNRYFERWHTALAGCLERGGLSSAHADRLASETLAAIQGGLILARARDDSRLFTEAIECQAARLTALLTARQRKAAPVSGGT